MQYSPFGRRRMLHRRFTMLATVLALAFLGAAPAANAAISIDDACPNPPNAGFLDILQYPSDVREAINCLADYDITEGTSSTTFSPGTEVSRWQMALFLIRQAEIHDINLPDGSDQGFVDIGSLPLSTRRAINQLVQLDITEGVSATRFAPDEPVPRWQMALFLTRLLDAAGVNLPSGTSQGFTDIGVFPTATETAINQLAQLDVTEGTGGTLFSPNLNVTRWQMALFLTRTLDTAGVTPSARPVSVRPAAPSGAPDLTRVSFDEDDDEKTRLVYTFDEPISSTVDIDHLWLVGWNGDLVSPESAEKSTDNANAVNVVFFNEDYDNAVAGVVTYDPLLDEGAVFDIDGYYNTQGSYPLGNVTLDAVDWPIDHPDLVDIGAFDSVDDTIEFEFDQDVDVEVGVDATYFHVVEEDGTVWTGTDVHDDDGDEVLLIEFDGMTNSQFGDLVRGFIDADAVEVEGGGANNLPMGIDQSSSGRTDTPYITDIDLKDAADGVVSFEFSEDLEAFSTNDGTFQVVFHDPTDLTWKVATSSAEERDDNDKDVVQVEFKGGTPLNSDIVLYANALDGAVTGFLDINDVSGPDSFLEKHTFRGYDTAGPDLESSKGSVVGLSDDTFTITLTFDEDVTTAFNEATELIGWNEDGDLIDISGGTLTIDPDDETVVEIEFGPGDTGTEELIDGDVVRFGIQGESVEDEFGFHSYPDGVGCNCAK